MATDATIQQVEVRFAPTWRQWQALQALKLPTTDADWAAVQEAVRRKEPPIDLCFGGAKGGGKSYFLCQFVFAYALAVAHYFDLQPRENVPHIGWIGRKIGQVFTATTLETWKRTIPEEFYTLRSASEKHPRHILIAGCVAVDYGGLDSRADLERFNSAEYGFIGVDQAEETTRDDVATLRGSRRLALTHPKTKELVYLPYRGLWTANPRQCWLKEDFVDRALPGHVFVPALHTDNKYLPANYIATLESSFGHRPDLIKAYRDGDWTALSGIDQVILQEFVEAAKRRYQVKPYIKRWLSVDPARFGDDMAVIIGGENTEIVDGRALPYSPEPTVVAEAAAMARRMGDCDEWRIPIIVETVGVCGVADQLRRQGFLVIEYVPAGKADDPEREYNARASVWSRVGRWMSDGFYDARIGAPFTLHEPADPMLSEIWRNVCDQLQWPWYDFRKGKVLISSKKDIKTMHSGKSPDYGDAYVNGVAHLGLVRPRYEDHGRIAEREHRTERPAVMHPLGF